MIESPASTSGEEQPEGAREALLGAPRAGLAVRSIGGGCTELVSLPRPEPAEGEILLRLRVCGLCGTDLFKLASGGAPHGAVLGHEVAGVVERAPGLPFEPGERIAVPHHMACGRCAFCRRGSETMCPAFREELLAPGGFSEHILVRPRAAAAAARRLPPHLSDEAAVFLEPAACVLRGIEKAGPPVEGAAAILGGGSMGLLHLLVLGAVAPELEVFVVELLQERRELSLRLGASGAFAPHEARERLLEATGGWGADVVFDTAGGMPALEAALDLGRKGSTVVLFAHGAAGEPARLDLNRLFKEERRVIGSYSGSLKEQDEIYRLLLDGRLDPSPLVTHRLPLSRFEEACELARGRKALKVLLHPDLPGQGGGAP
jgi:L-iditol 2-dehydrogenase